MSRSNHLPDWTAVVLAGGPGSRLRQVCPETAKALVPVLGRPFLDWLLLYLRACDLRRVLISTGHRAEQFRRYRGGEYLPPLELSTVRELLPLGTAGGFCHAVDCAGVHDFLLTLNGDTLLLAPLGPILRDFACDRAEAAIVAVPVDDCRRYGTLDIDTDGWVRGFREKRPGSGLANGGIYLFRQPALAHFPRQRPLSFELEVFPSLLASGHAVRAYPCAAPFLDIGIPEALADAPRFLERHFEPFLQQVHA